MTNIRNFCIIAHIDHGKTTLTDRILEATGTVAKGSSERLMDSNPIEKERGITIKLAPVRMNYTSPVTHDSLHSNFTYQLNLIDTPGHVDFNYEVSRALYACEGAVLVVDATKGIQAQTLANYSLAKEANLTIIPVINKIDMPAADPAKVEDELVENLGFKKAEILRVSAKTGEGVPALLEEIVRKIPPPITHNPSPITPHPLRAFIFNSTFDTHKGVIAFVKILEGQITPKTSDNLILYSNQEHFSPLGFGYFAPTMHSTHVLSSGEVGFIATGHKDIRAITIGDTITTPGSSITPVPGYHKPQPMVFMDLYPIDAGDYRNLIDALGKLALSDSALTYHAASSPALGHGFRVGFLGILHAEIVAERLQREFEVSVVNTSPSVPYHIHLTVSKHTTPPNTTAKPDFVEISSPSDWPRPELIQSVEEPMVALTIYTPESYVGGIMDLTQGKRGEFVDMQYISSRVKLSYLMPLAELITNYYDRLKSVSSGYASVSYEHAGYQPIDVVKVDILLNGESADALSFIAPRASAEGRGRTLVDKLKEVIPRAQIEIAIQAAIGGKIIARSTIKAYRKDVEAKLHGGDMTRNRKLLEKQKKGKKKMKMLGRVEIPQTAFTEVLKI